ncbi:MAG: hypothetical protein Unbinned3891contig1000_47 [Prokaryotic dsDNA virus sp.]|nr:MAG: hypothetical protein Unbinned3891contig1000_47 [Prokaryotic dsDNA virus sp.]|tara:strand:- start:67574 stop:67861 length:288 start_codon:yes stop_codon:yes gene_type:complete
MSNITKTTKQVIEDKLLVSLEEPGQAAMLLNASELDMLVTMFRYYLGGTEEHEGAEEREFLKGLLELRERAFGKRPKGKKRRMVWNEDDQDWEEA